MDGNVPDTPPTVVVPRRGRQKAWEQLQQVPGGSAGNALKREAAHPKPSLDEWLVLP